DTRLSGYMIENALVAGFTSVGMDVLLTGPIPTPAIGMLARSMRADLGVMISASHNPFDDNGIKLFGPDGFKLDDETEHQIEAAVQEPPVVGARPGRVRRFHGALEDYLRELHTRFAELDLTGQRILLDTANGATYRAAPEMFRRLGAHVDVLADEPDGRNINAGCGSTHLESLQTAMAEGDHDAGFAFDGDGDRVLAVDRTGEVVDGDELIALAALHLRERERLSGGGVVVTVMTNFGFHRAMESAGVEVATTAVGDRYVLDELRRRGWALGGEQSGHIIDLGLGPCGDGTASALLALEALGGRDLAERDAMQKLPQRLVNVRASSRQTLTAVMEGAAVKEAIDREQSALEGRGRVLVRASGTEPLIRVMVEAPSEEETGQVCVRLVELVEGQLVASSHPT
ncbi:MAG TPA: phosphoglucosamine mutase, partial [Solirubrobacteraceae bacterium]|nr:phosphoglucosamine mutase [Solirubrobacteraceae bacterium]